MANSKPTNSRHWFLWIAGAAVLAYATWTTAQYALQSIRITFAEEQTAIFDEMREKALRGNVTEAAQCLEYVVRYYPSGTKQQRGSNLELLVERARAQAVKSMVAHLRSKSETDEGNDPEAWIQKYAKRVESRPISVERAERVRSEATVSDSIKVLPVCVDVKELVTYYSSDSLLKPDIQKLDDLVLVQTYPFSGVDASYLYVYRSEQGSIGFVDCLRVPSQGRVEAKLTPDKDVVISADDVELLVLKSVADRPSAAGKK